jgi:hypothetical protein
MRCFVLALAVALGVAVFAAERRPGKQSGNGQRLTLALALRLANLVAQGDAAAILRQSREPLVVRDFVRIYPPDVSASRPLQAQIKKHYLLSGPYLGDQGYVGSYSVLDVRVSTRLPCPAQQRRIIREYARLVRRTLRERKLHIGLDVEPRRSEVPTMDYPALIGPVASNVDWKMVFSSVAGQWKIASLDLGAH